MVKRVLLTGDFHFGSCNSPCPEDLDYRPNKQQKILNRWYWDMVSDIGKVDAVLLNGDLVEGYNRNQNGLGCWTTDILEQANTAAKMLSYIDTKKFYVTNGSRYHTSENPSGDGIVAKMLGAEFGRYQILRVGGKRIHAIHKVSHAQYTGNRGNSLGSQITKAILNESEWGKFDVIVRAHAHYYVCLEVKDHMGIITPCWKGLDDFGFELGTGFVPEIGYVLLEISGGEINKTVFKQTLKGDMLFKEHKVD